MVDMVVFEIALCCMNDSVYNIIMKNELSSSSICYRQFQLGIVGRRGWCIVYVASPVFVLLVSGELRWKDSFDESSATILVPM